MIKKQNEDLSNYSTFQSGGTADELIIIESSAEALELIRNSQDSELHILGSGTNCLISDKGLAGTTLVLKSNTIELEADNILVADAGAWWDDLVQASISNKLWGLELMSGIPGSVGAAVIGNIAAYGQQVADTLIHVETIDYVTKEQKKIPASELGLNYRSSDLQSEDKQSILILKAAFQLSTEKTTELRYDAALSVASEIDKNPESLEERREIILEARKRAGSMYESSGIRTKTAGSFFRNPLVTREQAEHVLTFEERATTREKILQQNKIHGGDSLRVSAALVLLAAGFRRGQSFGNVRLHPNHALKIESIGNATSQEIYDVAQEIIQTVKTKLDITLTPEVRFLGDFN